MILSENHNPSSSSSSSSSLTNNNTSTSSSSLANNNNNSDSHSIIDNNNNNICVDNNTNKKLFIPINKFLLLSYLLLIIYAFYHRLISKESNIFTNNSIKIESFLKLLFLTTFTIFVNFIMNLFLFSNVNSLQNNNLQNSLQKNNLFKNVIKKFIKFLIYYFNFCIILQLYSQISGRMKSNIFRYFFTYFGNLWNITCLLFFIYFLFIYLPFYFLFKNKNYLKNFTKIVIFTCFLLSIFGLYHTLQPIEIIEQSITFPNTETLQKNTLQNLSQNNLQNTLQKNYLKIIALSDIHLGMYMNENDLQKIIKFKIIPEMETSLQNSLQNSKNSLQNNSLQKNNTIIVITGDFFTFESEFNIFYENSLFESLKLLLPYKENVFICLGNHDYDLLPKVVNNLKEFNLLMDQFIFLKNLKISIFGLHYYFKNVKENLSEQFLKFKNLQNNLQNTDNTLQNTLQNNNLLNNDKNLLNIILLHNPSHYKYILPYLNNLNGAKNSITFSGHYHAGQFSNRYFTKNSNKNSNKNTNNWSIVYSIIGEPDYGWYKKDLNNENKMIPILDIEEEIQFRINHKNNKENNEMNNNKEMDKNNNKNKKVDKKVDKKESNDKDENEGLHFLHVLSGTGFYGPPLRIGTRNELLILHVYY